MLMGIWRNRNPDALLIIAATLGNSMVVPKKVETKFLWLNSVPAQTHTHRETQIESKDVNRELSTNVYENICHITPKAETHKSINRMIGE